MKIHLNERTLEVAEETSLFELRDAEKPKADVLIYNGAAIVENVVLAEGDNVSLIERGVLPRADELEALMVARHTPGVHEKIKGATVGIAGLGGLGSAVAVALARIGVGRLILADFDIVEPSNLNRQQYFIDQLGLPKSAALEANLKRINPYVTYETHCIRVVPDNIDTLFGAVDVMFEAFDRAGLAPDHALEVRAELLLAGIEGVTGLAFLKHLLARRRVAFGQGRAVAKRGGERQGQGGGN